MSDTALQSMQRMLSGREAFRVAYTINPATGVESLSRMWWCKYDQYQEAAKHLDLYTDAGNSAETEYVSTPFAGRADSFPGTWVHSGCSQSNEADKLIQSLTRVYSIATNAELFARPAIPTFDNNILNLFGHKESEGDTVALVIYALTKESRAFCMAIADADLVTGLASGFSYAGRRFDVDPETNTGRLTVAFEKVANNAFVVGSPDLTWYSHKTTKQEQKHQMWMLVNKADTLTGLYTPDAGYSVTSVSISPSEKGSLSIQRTQLLKAFGASGSPYEETQTKTLDPHGFRSGTMNITLVKNHHLSDTDTPYGTPATATGYTLVDVDKTEEGNGLWTKVYRYEKPEWTAWVNTTTASNITYSGLGTNSESFTRIWVGIKIADKDTAVSNCRTGTGTACAASSGFRIDSAHAQDNGDGSITVQQTQRKSPGNNTGGNRLDYDGAILKSRKEVVVRTSGGIDKREAAIQSAYGKLFVRSSDSEAANKTAAEAAWTWAIIEESPHGWALVAGGIFDDATGVEIGGSEGTVNYAGNGVWEATRICYEAMPLTAVPAP